MHVSMHFSVVTQVVGAPVAGVAVTTAVARAADVGRASIRAATITHNPLFPLRQNSAMG